MKNNYIYIGLLAIVLGFLLGTSSLIGMVVIALICGIWILATDYQKSIYILAFYGILDYVIRKAIPAFAGPWDDSLLVLLLLLILYKWILYRKTPEFKWSPLDVPIFLYMLINILCIFINPYQMKIVIDGCRANIEFIFFFFACFNLIKYIKTVRNIYICLVVVAFIISLYGVYQYIVKVPMPAGWIDSVEKGIRTRAYSLIGSPNILGSFLALISPLTIGLFLVEKKLAMKIIYFGMYLTMLACLVFTYSRGAWIVFMLGIGVYILIKDIRLLIPAIVIMILILVFVPSVTERVLYAISPEYIQSSLRGGRLVRWGRGLAMISDNPYFGKGLGHVGGAVAKNFKIPGAFYMDNYYLKIATEIGLVGLFFLFALMWKTVKWCYIATRRVSDNYSKELLTSGFIGVISIACHNFVENIFEVPLMVCMFWLIVACIMSVWFNDKNSYK